MSGGSNRPSGPRSCVHANVRQRSASIARVAAGGSHPAVRVFCGARAGRFPAGPFRALSRRPFRSFCEAPFGPLRSIPLRALPGGTLRAFCGRPFRPFRSGPLGALRGAALRPLSRRPFRPFYEAPFGPLRSISFRALPGGTLRAFCGRPLWPFRGGPLRTLRRAALRVLSRRPFRAFRETPFGPLGASRFLRTALRLWPLGSRRAVGLCWRIKLLGEARLLLRWFGKNMPFDGNRAALAIFRRRTFDPLTRTASHPLACASRRYVCAGRGGDDGAPCPLPAPPRAGASAFCALRRQAPFAAAVVPRFAVRVRRSMARRDRAPDSRSRVSPS